MKISYIFYGLLTIIVSSILFIYNILHIQYYDMLSLIATILFMVTQAVWFFIILNHSSIFIRLVFIGNIPKIKIFLEEKIIPIYLILILFL